MKDSTIEGPFKPAESGIVEEGVAEAFTPVDQLAFDFTEPEEARRPYNTEIQPPSGPSLFDLHPIDLQEARPLTWEKGKKRREDIERYLDGNEFLNFKGTDRFADLLNKPFNPQTEKQLLLFRDWLYGRFMKGLSFPDMVSAYYDVIRLLSKITFRLKGQGENEHLQAMVNVLGEPFVMHHDPGRRELDYVRDFIYNSPKITKPEQRGLMMTLYAVLINYVCTADYVHERTDTMTPQLKELVRAEQADMRAMSHELFDAIRTQRTEGVRSSMYQDHLFHDDSEVWVMMNPIEFKETFREVLAHMYLADEHDVLEEGISSIQETVVKTESVTVSGEGVSFDTKVDWLLGSDGELYFTSNRAGRVAVSDVFKRHGQEAYYELFHTSVIARVHDMVIPGQSTDNLPDDASHETFARNVRDLAKQGGSPDELRTIIKGFLIPRRNNIRNTDKLRSDEEHEQRRARELMGMKPVNGKMYELSGGRRRTRRAEAMCKQYESEDFYKSFLAKPPQWTYHVPYDKPIFTKTRVIREQKSDADEIVGSL